MNRFSASIVLCQVSLEDFLNIEPEERIARFGGFIGADTVVRGKSGIKTLNFLLTFILFYIHARALFFITIISSRRNLTSTWNVVPGLLK